MVAALLTKITTTNDQRLNHNGVEKHPADSRSINSAVLAFHGRNVPTITISSYLGRINRYCPTTYEVFLSLLVYFDRMTDEMSSQFVVDSFNIHRLVIAGVTCASKFFSDVFFTNSRYAKVGGLPLLELNHLELQFLLLNDFRLSIPLSELEDYGTMLVQFYGREVLQSRVNSIPPRLTPAEGHSHQSSSADNDGSVRIENAAAAAVAAGVAAGV
ncbi:cyclin-domain-containing protein [Ascobolus immersus RN42]|uniref:Cyclin n=1 Tax=Ascobolus immersus RN42 TaxID=1160509 RepID=A0A3N4I9Z8_ASCIM|nr:cyclin-domain-containing protein [Ascobolus immersus RN42]